MLALTFENGSISLIDASTGNSKSLFNQNGFKISKALFHPSGEFLLSCCSDKKVRVWSIKTKKQFSYFPFENEIIHIGFDDQGILSLLEKSRTDLLLRKIEIKSEVCTDLMDPMKYSINKEIIGGAYNLKRNMFAMKNSAHTLSLFDFTNNQQKLLQLDPLVGINLNKEMIFDSKGSWLFTRRSNCSIQVWNIESEEILVNLIDSSSAVESMAFDRSRNYLITGNRDGRVELWNIQKQKLIAYAQGHLNEINHTFFINEGGFIITASHDTSICCWSIEEALGKTDLILRWSINRKALMASDCQYEQAIGLTKTDKQLLEQLK